MDSVNSLHYLLHHTATLLYRQSDQVLQERLGIGMSQYKLLVMLQEQPGGQQRYLAERLGQTEASVSRQIKLLLQKGMLAVKVNPDNRREHITAPTPKGVKITQVAKETLEEYHQPAFTGLSDKQRDHLAEVLHYLHTEYCKESTPYACDLPAL